MNLKPHSEDADLIYDTLNGTCKTVHGVIEELELPYTIEEVEEVLLDMNLGMCPGCEWWMEIGEFVDADGNEVGCDQCQDKDD